MSKNTKNYILVTGGAGFIGTNLIKGLLKDTKYQIISLDNYISGSKSNHIINKRVKYIKGETKNISAKFKNLRKKIKLIFHFGEFSRVFQSFDNKKSLIYSNIYGTVEVIEFCRENNIKIIYSSTSAGFGNNFADKHLSPYTFTKCNSLDMIINYSKWFGLKYEMLYFYNVYGGNEKIKENMKAVIDIFKDCKRKNKYLPVVKPGKQSRVFTNIDDVIKACLLIMRKNRNAHYLIKAKKSYKMIEIAKMFNHPFKFIKKRKGERFASSAPREIRNIKVNQILCKKDIKEYLKEEFL